MARRAESFHRRGRGCDPVSGGGGEKEAMRHLATLFLALGVMGTGGCGSGSGDAAPDASRATDSSSPPGDAGGSRPDGGPVEAGADRVVADGASDAVHHEAGDSGNGTEAGEGGGPCSTVPAGASALKYDTLAFCLEPTTADISCTSTPTTRLYSGSWYDTPPDSSHYSMESGLLAISLNGGVMTQRQDSKQGSLPYLLAGNGFYAEFAVRLSDNDPDHWPALWLMPEEHNLAQSDHLSSDPAGYERWMEIDCDEGGFYSGSLNTLIDWQGIYPKYANTVWNDYGKLPALDRTTEHIFGVSYDPVGQVVQFWLDGVATYSHSTSTINDVINTYHYFLLIDAQTHGANLPYEMIVRYLSAWIK
jgi:hypothetical protein